ncbi:MAG TPA: DUF805 domain-containing protein [Phenylobacterium sp.]|nr:DUF805 domain-containing protein [Phenylobacterium sp.]
MLSLMFEPLRKYATFTGRARRTEYWLFWLFTFVVEMVVGGLTGSFSHGIEYMTTVSFGLMLYLVVALALIVPSLAVAVRRLHDTNRSGWWVLIGLLPVLGALVLLVFMVLPGTVGANSYGEDPKAGLQPAAA